MKRTLFAGLGVGATALAVVLAGCSADAPTGVEPRLGAPVVMGAVTRYQPLADDVTVKATIGSEGGSFELPQAGLTVTVPAGAVSEPVTFKATARRGAIVAYDFEPSGHFDVPLQVTQDLYYTSWHHQTDLTDVVAGYYTGPGALDDEQGEAEVSELPPSTVNVDKCKITFEVSHFSGYVIATGRNRHE
jgi:hypothetical protein